MSSVQIVVSKRDGNPCHLRLGLYLDGRILLSALNIDGDGLRMTAAFDFHLQTTVYVGANFCNDIS